MDRPGTHELTQLLAAWSDGEEEALEKLAPLVHAELYRLAKRYMSRERPDHLLQTSALINEAYVRLIDWNLVIRNWVPETITRSPGWIPSSTT